MLPAGDVHKFSSCRAQGEANPKSRERQKQSLHSPSNTQNMVTHFVHTDSALCTRPSAKDVEREIRSGQTILDDLGFVDAFRINYGFNNGFLPRALYVRISDVSWY